MRQATDHGFRARGFRGLGFIRGLGVEGVWVERLRGSGV